jgi:hypothetical protein
LSQYKISRNLCGVLKQNSGKSWAQSVLMSPYKFFGPVCEGLIHFIWICQPHPEESWNQRLEKGKGSNKQASYLSLFVSSHVLCLVLYIWVFVVWFFLWLISMNTVSRQYIFTILTNLLILFGWFLTALALCLRILEAP